MKVLSIVSAVMGVAFIGAASGADITLYYSPNCPHCHHARDFISGTLIYEYPTISVTEVNVTNPDNREMFRETVNKCEFKSGGVPVMVIGEKCMQGYADFMQNDIRAAVEADMTDDAKNQAAENKKAMESDADAFKSANQDRKNAISEFNPDAKKKSKGLIGGWGWGLLIVLIAGIGFTLVRKEKK